MNKRYFLWVLLVIPAALIRYWRRDRKKNGGENPALEGLRLATSGPPAMTEADVARVESTLGVTLPRLYRDLLKLCTLPKNDTGLLLLSADALIEANEAMQKKETDRPGTWSDHFFVIGTAPLTEFFILLDQDRQAVYAAKTAEETWDPSNIAKHKVTDTFGVFLYQAYSRQE